MKSRKQVSLVGTRSPIKRSWIRIISAIHDPQEIRQSGPRPDARLLRQPALEGLTRSARTDSPRKIGRNKFRRSGGGGGGEAFGGGEAAPIRAREVALPKNPLRMLNTLSSISVQESRIQYLCDPQWFSDTASRGPTTIVAPESQFRTCPSDHDGYPVAMHSSQQFTRGWYQTQHSKRSVSTYSNDVASHHSLICAPAASSNHSKCNYCQQITMRHAYVISTDSKFTRHFTKIRYDWFYTIAQRLNYNGESDFTRKTLKIHAINPKSTR
ncbi:hypothetical protein F511_26381 [Dorcoceras hygrometricum]|uniref:Uncharacterized protein n=1 Tax=Dorcoceras hygrometricum TaxID=472368 RepID=A0A2Z7DDX0_9LAMI|nr:hypothetical protein F511_26381 [Dorcoceras hygrometricum]